MGYLAAINERMNKSWVIVPTLVIEWLDPYHRKDELKDPFILSILSQLLKRLHVSIKTMEKNISYCYTPLANF